eukprot:UN04756
MEPLLSPGPPTIKSPQLTRSKSDGKLINELRHGNHTSVIHSVRPNDGISNYENDTNVLTFDEKRDRNSDVETTITTITGAEFDDLEFLHDFLEHESKKPFFESNFCKINCKNICIFGIILTILV